MNTLEELVKDSSSYSEILRRMKKSITGASIRSLKKKIQVLNINTTHFSRHVSNSKERYFNTKIPWQALLIKNKYPYRVTGKRITTALLESGMPHKCNRCSITHWLDIKITLEVNHIDGDYLNNEITNLEFLCPNCHSLTPNFYRKKKPTLQKLCECGSFIKLKTSKKCHKCATASNGFHNRKVIRPSKEELEILV